MPPECCHFSFQTLTHSSLPQVNDSIQLDLATNKVQDIITFEVGNLCMVTGGANAGRVGTMISRYEYLSRTLNF